MAFDGELGLVPPSGPGLGTNSGVAHEHAVVSDAAVYCDGLATWASRLGVPPIGASISPDARRGFDATLNWWRQGRGASVVTGRTNRAVDQHVSPRPDVAPDSVLVGCLLRGRADVRGARDWSISLKSSDVFVTDYGEPMSMRWSSHSLVFLVLSKERLGLSPGDAGMRRIEVLKPSGLPHLLATHLRALGDEGDRLAPPEAAFGRALAVELATFCVTSVWGGRSTGDREGHAKLLAAAKHHVEANFHEAGMSATRISDALGVSRSNLYRAFASADLTVGGYLRATRMRRASELIAARTTDADLADVAMACGYADLSAFGKAFRRFAGTTPSAWRRSVARRFDLDTTPDAGRLDES